MRFRSSAVHQGRPSNPADTMQGDSLETCACPGEKDTANNGINPGCMTAGQGAWIKSCCL